MNPTIKTTEVIEVTRGGIKKDKSFDRDANE